MKMFFFLTIGFASFALAEDASHPDCVKMYEKIYATFQASPPHSREVFAKVKAAADKVVEVHPVCKEKISRLKKYMDEYGDFEPSKAGAMESIHNASVDCKKVQYNEIDAATVLAEKKKSEEDKTNAKQLKTFTNSYNQLCEKMKCLMTRDKISFDKVVDKYIASLNWVKTPYQKKLQHQWFKELDVESCVK